jgi:hypothetical protein
VPEPNIEAVNERLAVISRSVSVRAIAVLVQNGAGWHSSPRLAARANIATRTVSPASSHPAG